MTLSVAEFGCETVSSVSPQLALEAQLVVDNLVLRRALMSFLTVCAFFRDLQAAYGLSIVDGDANLRKITDIRSVPAASKFSGSSSQLKRALDDDLSFAQSVHAAWMNQFGDPAAAVATLFCVLRSFSDSAVAITEADVDNCTGIEILNTSIDLNDQREVATADESLATRTQLVERIARYNSSTLLRLLQQRAGVATAAGRAEASNYLQILRRHDLADVYHYTIVLNSCCARVSPRSSFNRPSCVPWCTNDTTL